MVEPCIPRGSECISCTVDRIGTMAANRRVDTLDIFGSLRQRRHSISRAMMSPRSARSARLGTCLIPILTLVSFVWASFGDDVTLLHRGARWVYLDDGSDQGTLWREPGFDDSGWTLGSAQFGYGDADEATEVGFGPDPNNKFITTYFRHRFNESDPLLIPGLLLHLVRDDGAVIYLNGVEVGRSNMPAGVIDFQTLALTPVNGDEEGTFFEASIDPSHLVSGTNVLAVEIHQADPASSDISFDFDLVAFDGTPVVTRGPYLQLATDSSIGVRWRTNANTDTFVAYGLAPDDLSSQVSDASVTTEHKIVVRNLEPDTTYYYGIGTTSEILIGGDDEHFFRTSPVPGTPTDTRVWVIGDSGTANEDAARVRDAYISFAGNDRADVWLMLGDNAYLRGTDEQYQRAVFDMYADILPTTPVWPTLGNHDQQSARSANQAGVYYDIFSLPRQGEAGGLASGTEAYYSFDFGNIHFICLDSQDSDRSATGAMALWLEADLADTLADWTIAFWHHPPYSKGSHDSDDATDSGGRLFEMREVFLPILENHGVDLVLSGHSHSIERSYLLDGHYDTSNTLAPNMIADGRDGRETGDGAYRKPSSGAAAHEGAVYVVAGSSGLIDDNATLDHPAMFTSILALGSMVLDVSDQRLDATFIDDLGTVVDTFTIRKGEQPVPCLSLEVDQLVAGEVSTFTVRGGVPGESVGVLWGNQPGQYVSDDGTWCIDFGFQIPEPPTSRVVVFGEFDATGTFTRNFRVGGGTSGFALKLQAARSGSCPAACMSNVIDAVIE